MKCCMCAGSDRPLHRYGEASVYSSRPGKILYACDLCDPILDGGFSCSVTDAAGVEYTLTACECDNTHEQNNTVCRWCHARGRQ